MEVETFEETARREVLEETGLVVCHRNHFFPSSVTGSLLTFLLSHP